MRLAAPLLVVSGGLLLTCQMSRAEDNAPGLPGIVQSLAISGSARAAYWSSSMNLDGKNNLPVGALWLKAEPRLSEDAAMVVEGWVMNDDAIRGGGRQGRLREGYLSASLGDADFRIGKQLVIWGRADRLNPTDNISPRDYTLPVAEDDDQRLGAYAAKAVYNFKDWSLTGLWAPKFAPNVLPLPHTPGLNFGERVPDAQQGGIKIEQTGKTIDWSMSYYHGLDLNPDISVATSGGNGVNLQLNHNRLRVFGTDAATVLGRYSLRAEAAYTLTEDQEGGNPFVKNPFFYLVAGGDRSFFEYLNINLQYYFRQVTRYQNPLDQPDPLLRTVAIQEAVVNNQFERVQHGLTFRISNKWLNETLEGEIAGIASLTRPDYVIKPKLVYAFNDHWKGSLGLNLFRGENTGFYGRLRDNSAVFAEIKYGF